MWGSFFSKIQAWISCQIERSIREPSENKTGVRIPIPVALFTELLVGCFLILFYSLTTNKIPGSHWATRPNGHSFVFVEKNLLKPRECFSGVGLEEDDEEDEEEPDLVGWWFGCFELTGDLNRLFASESEGLKGVLYIFTGDSLPTRCILAEVGLSISAISTLCKFILLVVGLSSAKLSPLWVLSRDGDPPNSVWGRINFNCLPRRNMVSWHSASFSAAAANSVS